MQTFAIGDRVVVESNLLPSGEEGAFGSAPIGDEGVVEHIRGGDRPSVYAAGWTLHPDAFLKLDDLDALAAQRAPLEVGDKVRLAGPHFYGGDVFDHEAALGEVGTVCRDGGYPAACNPASPDYNVGVRWHETGRTSAVWPATLERIVEEPEAPAPALSVGDRVRVAYPAGVSAHTTGDVYFDGEVVEVCDDGCARVEAGGGRQYVHETYLTKVDEEAPARYEVGDLVEFTEDYGHWTPGTVVRVTGTEPAFVGGLLLDIEDALGRGGTVYDSRVKPHLADVIEGVFYEDLDDESKAEADAQGEEPLAAWERELLAAHGGDLFLLPEPEAVGFDPDMERRADAVALAYDVIPDEDPLVEDVLAVARFILGEGGAS